MGLATRAGVAVGPGPRRRRGGPARLAAAALLWAGCLGCYPGHLLQGQLRLLSSRQPVAEAREDPSLDPRLRRRLSLAEEVRGFARALGLEVGDNYTSYVPWEGDRIVTTLVRTRPGELEPAGFFYPVLGRLPYRGYFDRKRAESRAASLRAEGFDVCVSGVSAYSTLGWFDDPLTGPMLRSAPSDDRLVEVLLHELLHATFYSGDQPDFSEGLASFVGQEGAVLFYREQGDPEAAARTRARILGERRLAAELLGLRERVAGLYATSNPGPERDAARRALEEDARARVAGLDLGPDRDGPATARGLHLSDACLALRGTYATDLPALAERFRADGGDLRRWIARIRTLDGPDPRGALLGAAGPPP